MLPGIENELSLDYAKCINFRICNVMVVKTA